MIISNNIITPNGGGVSLPSGVIVIWSGSSTDIPDGWTLCDGNNGTPNLSGRFVLSYGGSYTTVGATGGEETHKLTVNEMPSHNHTLDLAGGDLTSSISGTYSKNVKPSTRANLASINNTGGSKAHNNMPPYYVLCYIMKL